MKTSTYSLIRLAIIAGSFSFTFPFQTQADTVGFWEFSDGDAGTTASSIQSSVHGSKLIGTASGHEGGSAPVYSSDVPGRVIRNGKEGSVLNENNATSLSFTGGAKNSGGIVSIKTTPGDEIWLQPQSFTMEAFVKTGASQLFAVWFGKNIGGGALSWSAGSSWTSGKVKLRADNMNSTFTQFQYADIPSQAATNANTSWHHIALTYDVSTKTLSFYEDYKLTGKLVLPPGISLQYDNGDLTFGDGTSDAEGSAYTGLMDEVRFSDKVLTPDEFLRAE